MDLPVPVPATLTMGVVSVGASPPEPADSVFVPGAVAGAAVLLCCEPAEINNCDRGCEDKGGGKRERWRGGEGETVGDGEEWRGKVIEKYSS